MRRRIRFSFLKKALGLLPPSGSGYKIFRVVGSHLESLVFSASPWKREGAWIRDLNQAQHKDAGFHIYLDEEDARSAYTHCLRNRIVPKYMALPVYSIRKVRYQDVVAYGVGDGMRLPDAKVVVAKRMLVEPS